MSLKEKSVNALVWSFIDSFGAYFVKFGFTIAIARKLDPHDYGLIGMIGVFIALASIISESGFASALIQKKEPVQKDYSTVFLFSMFISLLLYLILFAAAGYIADFFREPMLKIITRISSLGIILGSLVTVQVAIMNKNLDFRSQAKINLISALVSGITGVILAYLGYGVWALVFMTIAGSLISSVLFWINSKWKPSWSFSVASFKSLYKYGVNIFFQGFTSVLLDKIYYPLIGRFFDAVQLGYFSGADRFYQVFVRRVTIAYGKVTFPVFSLLQDRKEDFYTAYRKTAVALAFVLIPFSTFLIISAKPAILILLTEKWSNSIPFLQLLYADGFFFPFLLLNQNVLNAMGKSRLSLQIDTLKKVFIITGILVTFRLGIKALIISQVISSLFGLLYSSLLIRKNMPGVRVMRGLLPVIFSSLAFAATSVLICTFIDSEIICLLVQLICLAFYVLIHKVLKTEGYQFLMSLAGSGFKFRRIN